MTTELKVLMEYDGTTASMRVLDMPEKFRYKFAFTASNGVEVRSVAGPDLDLRKIYLRGHTNGYDHDVETIDCTREEFDAYVLALREAKAEMARRAGWDTPVVVVI